MASSSSSSSITINSLQQQELSSISLCKCFSPSIVSPFTNSSSFSSPKHALKLKFSPFLLAKPPVITFCTLNDKIWTKFDSLCDFNENLASGYLSNECKDEKVGGRSGNNGKKSGNFGERLSLGKRGENGAQNCVYRRGGKRVVRKVEENVGKVGNGDVWIRKELSDCESRGEKGSRVWSRRGKEGNSMSVGVNGSVDREVVIGGGDCESRGEKGYRVSSRRGKEGNSMSVGVNGSVDREVIIGGGDCESKGEKSYKASSRRGKEGISMSVGVNGSVDRKVIIGGGGDKVKKKKEKLSKKSKVDSPEWMLRAGLDMCSKKGDVMGAISMYDNAVKEGVKMGVYHYTVLLYLCSSAAMGIIRPAKSGSGSRSLDSVAPRNLDDDEDDDDGSDDTDDEVRDTEVEAQKLEINEIRVSDDVKKHALEKGFEIYERMCLDKVEMNEAALTSVARMAMAMGDGDKALDMVNQMKSMGISPKLRSYGPALSVFTSNGDVEKAFAVEKHMLENGVHPEEPELEALLRVSVETGKADRVYYLLHKLRTAVRFVSPSTAELIEKWFKSKEASRVGKRKWDHDMISQTMENGGGGWHGLGWLGRGKWSVSRTSVGADGLCKCCAEKLALIDLDPEETEKFAESVASIAIKKEKNSSFQKFQRWLDYYGPFEAVVDAANVGLYSQRKFKPSKVNVVVNGIRQMLSSTKWPLIVLHNRRVTGGKLDRPIDKDLVERWRNADALYPTPTGSNDDWYWLYAAIRFKGLLVTNDEMRDHTFQLLGNDFFPKWKERHQVRYTFSEVGPVFHMPPPCSVVIQESESGHWHIPIASEHQSEEERIWLCVTRPKSLIGLQSRKVGESSAEDSEEDINEEKQHKSSNSHSSNKLKASSAS